MAYKSFCDSQPELHLQMKAALGTAQRAFDRNTQRNVQKALTVALVNVLEDNPSGKADGHLRGYLKRELADIYGWLDEDRETAVSRGLNIGLGMGAVVGVVLLAVPLLVGLPALNLLGIALDCSDRWGLLGVFTAGGMGAFGAVLSVLGRLRISVEELAHRRAARSGRTPVHARQLARRMRQEGLYRVFVGWILAVAVYLLLSGGIVPVFDVPATATGVCFPAGSAATPVTGTEFWGFWCAVGFVAGFNERWAFGILRRDTTDKTGTVGKD